MKKQTKNSYTEKQRTYDNACSVCAVRDSIYREEYPNRKYPKNHPDSFDYRISDYDKTKTDWRIYDSNEGAW